MKRKEPTLNAKLRFCVEQKMKKQGLKMEKKISSGGFFTSPTYDMRTVYNLKDLNELNRQGFWLAEDAGLFLLNMILTND